MCVTLNEGQGQYNWHVMHAHVQGSHLAKFDDVDLNSFQGIACEGHTHRHIHTAHTHRHTHKVAYDFGKKIQVEISPFSDACVFRLWMPLRKRWAREESSWRYWITYPATCPLFCLCVILSPSATNSKCTHSHTHSCQPSRVFRNFSGSDIEHFSSIHWQWHSAKHFSLIVFYTSVCPSVTLLKATCAENVYIVLPFQR